MSVASLSERRMRISFTRPWALELATTGITLNFVAPGPTETALSRANPPGSDRETRYLSGVLAWRIGQSEEIALVSSLLSEESGFMTG